MGVHMTAATLMARPNLIAKPPSDEVMTGSTPSGSDGRMGSFRMSTSTGVAKYMTTVAMSTDTTMMVRRRRSSPR